MINNKTMGKIALAIIEHQQHVLIGRIRVEKSGEFGGMPYVFPGGKVEKGETIEEAVVREAKEETGLNVKVVNKIGFNIHPITHKEVHYYHCCNINNSSLDGHPETKLPPDEDIELLKWVPLYDLKKYMPDTCLFNYFHVLMQMEQINSVII